MKQPRLLVPCLALALGWLVGAGAPRALAQSAAAPAAKPSASGPRVGVVAFERSGLTPADAPDVASLLADRLATRGISKVVGPSALGAPATADAPADQVRAWATQAGVGSIVLGRMTRVGTRLSIDAKLASGATGQPFANFVAEVARPEDLASAVDSLAGQIAERAAAVEPAAPAAPAAGAPARKKDVSADNPLGIGIRKDAPLSIQSAELEAIQEGKARRFQFTGNVRVTQDNVSLNADRLDAFYPEGATQPERLVARGHVVVTQADKRASCDEATFLNKEQRILCRGNAEMRQGDDRVKGKEIELKLDTEQMFVRGGAEVRIQPRSEASKTPAAPAATPATAPAPEPAAPGAAVSTGAPK